jgi:hypothetical protein
MLMFLKYSHAVAVVRSSRKIAKVLTFEGCMVQYIRNHGTDEMRNM